MGSRAFLTFSLLVCAPILGCGDFAGWMRQYTYPPDFHYITQEQLRSTMWELAYHSRELNRLVSSPETAQLHRTEIVEQLGAMEQAAASLSGWPTNHPTVDRNLPDFRRDLRVARESVEREPPNFRPAVSLSHGCAYCHGGGSPGNRSHYGIYRYFG